jgi:NADH-quinone oxidoreductase subunit C
MHPLETLKQHLSASLSLAPTLEAGELVLRVTPENIIPTVRFLKEDQLSAFEQLMDICGVDYLGRTPRFEVVYHFLSIRHNHRIRLVLSLDEKTLIPSLTSLFVSAGWFEREVFDMYGLGFENHTDLRRILTDYTFEGYPLRKDFPLVGFTEVYYAENQKRVASRPVSLSEPFREFDFKSPWEGMKTLFPHSSSVTPAQAGAQGYKEDLEKDSNTP